MASTSSGSFEHYAQYSNRSNNNGVVSSGDDSTVILNSRFQEFGIDAKMRASSVKSIPIDRSPWFGVTEWETEKKEKMSKDEIEELRKSVLRTNRPVNPWYETQKKIGSANNSLTTSPSSTASSVSSKSSHTTQNYSNSHDQPFENVASSSRITVLSPTFHARAVRVDSHMDENDKIKPIQSENQRLWKNKPNGLGWQKVDYMNGPIGERNRVTQTGLTQVHRRPMQEHARSTGTMRIPPNLMQKREQKPPVISTKRAEDYAMDLSQMLASDIKLLEELEAESLERKSAISNRARNTADRSPTGFTTIEKRLETDKSECNFQKSESVHKSHKNISDFIEGNKVNQRPASNQPVNLTDMQICASCRKAITDVVLQAMGNSFHPRCFRCEKCFRCLDGVPFAVSNDGRVFCMQDYEKMYAVPCAACHQPITSNNEYGQLVRVIVQENEYHLECYICEGCGLRLNNEPGNQCYPIGSRLLCRSCHRQWSRLSDGLNQPITDL